MFRLLPSRPSFRIRPVGLAAVLALCTAVHGQVGRRMMMMNDDGATRDFVAFAAPDLALLTAPDVDRADLPAAIRILRLSEDQAAALAALVDAYLEQIAGIEWERDLVERGPVEPPRAEGAEPDGPSPRTVIEGVLREAGIDPERVNGGDLELRVALGISSSADPSDAEAPPELSVSVELGPREGIELSAEERERLREAAVRIAAEIERMELARMERRAGAGAGEGGGMGPGEPTMPEIRERVATMHAAIAEYRRARKAAFAQFANRAQLILAEGQVERWPEFERTLRRRHTLPWGVLSGERIDLPALAAEALGDAEASEAVAEILVAMELELDGALQARNPLLEQVDSEIDLALIRLDAAKIVRTQDALVDACVRVRDATLRALDALASVEPERFGPVRAAALADAFPTVERRGPAERAFDILEATDGLEPDLRDAVAGMRRSWAFERDELAAAAVRAVLRAEPARRRAEVRGIVEQIDAERAARLDPGDDLEAEALARLSALDRRTLRTIRAMVPPEIAETLPEPPDDLESQPVRVERSVGGAP